ncbi:MAG: cyclase family protein [Candidatus Eremiobacteraeota bacterium]|nr:cyclase family protein [Candidatus Eremiobacteraeota bacterium]
MKFYDLTIPIKNKMAVYEGDPGVSVESFSSMKKGDPYNLLNVQMGSHTGTHIDAPFHFFQNGKSVDDIPLKTLVGPARVYLIRNEKIITKQILQNMDFNGVERALFKTDHSFLRDRYSRFRSDYVHLDLDAAGYLVGKGMKIVGIDSFSVESYSRKDHLSHKVLLGSGITILEMLDLKKVEPGDYELICLPLKIHEGDGAPVRAILRTL